MASSEVFQSSRHFKLWEYRVSFQQALIRSPATPEINTNIDLAFWGVEYLNISDEFHGLDLVVSEAVRIPVKVSEHCRKFTLTSARNEFCIAAMSCRVFENTLDIFDSSLAHISDAEPRDVGRLLAKF